MLNINESDAEIMEMLQTMAADMNITVDELIQTIEEAKRKFYKTQLS